MSFVNFVSSLPRLVDVSFQQEDKILNQDAIDYETLVATYYCKDSVPILTKENASTVLAPFACFQQAYFEMSFDERYEVLKKISRSVVLPYPDGVHLVHQWLLDGHPDGLVPCLNNNGQHGVFRLRSATFYIFSKSRMPPMLAVRFSSSPKGMYLQSRFRQEFGSDTTMVVSFTFPRMGLKSQYNHSIGGDIIEREDIDPAVRKYHTERYEEMAYLYHVMNGGGDYWSEEWSSNLRHLSRVSLEQQSWKLLNPYVREEKPLVFAGYSFHPLCQNTSGMHSYKMVYFSPQLATRSISTVEEVKEWAVPKAFNSELYSKDMKLKLLLRLALFNTPVIPTKKFSRNDFKILEEKEGRESFTDGCGFISKNLAEQVFQYVLDFKKFEKKYKNEAERYNADQDDTGYEEFDGIDDTLGELKGYLPYAYQIRFLGMKGMLCIHPNIKEEYGCELVFPKSMLKVKYGEHVDNTVLETLHIVGFSRPCGYANVNSTIMHMLSGCEEGTKISELIKQAAKEHVESVSEKYLTPNVAELIDQYVKDGDFSSLNILASTKNEKLAFMAGPFRNKILPLRIPFKKARRFYVVPDPLGKLEKGQVFIQTTRVWTGTVALTKEPCVHRGDLRKVTAVDLPEYKDFVDVLIVPIKGDRPLTNMIAGSDMDGDQLFAMQEEVDSLIEYEPGQFDEPYGSEETRVFEPDVFKDWVGIRHYYADYLGKNWTKDEQWSGEKATMKRLSVLVNRAIDAPKNGFISVKCEEKDLQIVKRFPGYPHYHQSKRGPLRISSSLVGQVHDQMMQDVSQRLHYKAPDRNISIVDDREHLSMRIKYAIVNFLQEFNGSTDFNTGLIKVFTSFIAEIVEMAKAQSSLRVQFVSEFLNLFWRFLSISFLNPNKKLLLFGLTTSLQCITVQVKKELTDAIMNDNVSVILLPGLCKEQLDMHGISLEKLPESDYTCSIYQIEDFKKLVVNILFPDFLERIQLDIGMNCLYWEELCHAVEFSTKQFLHIRETFSRSETPEAQNRIGMMVLHENNSNSVRWFEKSAAGGFIDSMLMLSKIYELGLAGVQKDPKKAVKYLLEALELERRSEYLLKIGDIYYFDLKDYYNAYNYYQMAADMGCTTAKSNIANMNCRGEGCKQNEPITFEIYLKMAEEGDERAQYEVATIYYNGEGVEKNLTKALEWFEISANNGNTDSMVVLGEYYQESDSETSYYWYLMAAQAGNTMGMVALVDFLDDDDKLAFEYLHKAAMLGDDCARANLVRVYLYGKYGQHQDLKNAVMWFNKVEDEDYKCELEMALLEEGVDIESYSKIAITNKIPTLDIK